MESRDKHRREHGSLVDNERSACLWDVGAPDFVAAVCVTPDGEDVLWLVSKTELDAEHPRCGRAEQPHEKLGRLPHTVRERIWGDSLRCGRPTAAGKPCRHRVKEPGQICDMHARPRCDGCGQIMLNQGGVWGCFGCHPDRYWTPVEDPS
jgi:hypothetical protein